MPIIDFILSSFKAKFFGWFFAQRCNKMVLGVVTLSRRHNCRCNSYLILKEEDTVLNHTKHNHDEELIKYLNIIFRHSIKERAKYTREGTKI